MHDAQVASLLARLSAALRSLALDFEIEVSYDHGGLYVLTQRGAETVCDTLPPPPPLGGEGGEYVGVYLHGGADLSTLPMNPALRTEIREALDALLRLRPVIHLGCDHADVEFIYREGLRSRAVRYGRATGARLN